jgi:diguanylate cyclase (GGDEF)-like protein
MEYTAIVMYAISVLWILVRRIRGPLMTRYAVSMSWFALASLSFTYSQMWNHQWWLAHIIFFAGLLLLSSAVIQAYIYTRSFTQVSSQADLMAEILTQKNRAEDAMLELHHANRELTRLAATDPLTGAANRREFMQRAEQEVSRSQRNGSPLALLMIDLDHFKRVNDRYNHHVGDIVLMEFVKLCQSHLRNIDLLGRFGGEEFTVLLPATNIDSARIVAEKLRHTMEHHTINANGEQISITISIGIAQYKPGDSIESWINTADERMYQAKRLGRNRVEYE